MSKNPTTRSKVNMPMGQRKSGLAVPADQVDVCKHMAVINRITPTFTRYVCADCQEQVVLVPLTMKIMTEPQFDQLQMQQVMADRAAQRKQKTGLITPDEARQQTQEGQK